MTTFRYSLGLLLLVAVCSLSGCFGSPPSNFYLLNDVPGGVPVTAEVSRRVGVGPVRVANYIDRPQVVRRLDRYRLDIKEFERWGEPLSDMIPRVLRLNLAERLGPDTVIQTPARFRVVLSHRLEVDILRFDSDPEGNVVLDAEWRLFTGGTNEALVMSKISSIREPSRGADYPEMTSTMSAALARLSDELAAVIRATPAAS